MFGSNCFFQRPWNCLFCSFFTESAFRLWTPWIRERSPKRPRPGDVRAGSCQTLQLDQPRFFGVTTPKDRMVGGWWGEFVGCGKWICESFWVQKVHFGGKEVVFRFCGWMMLNVHMVRSGGVWFRAPVDVPIGQWLVLYETCRLQVAGSCVVICCLYISIGGCSCLLPFNRFPEVMIGYHLAYDASLKVPRRKTTWGSLVDFSFCI